MDDYNDYAVPVDTECISQDIDDIDLYAEHIYDNQEELEDESDIDFEY